MILRFLSQELSVIPDTEVATRFLCVLCVFAGGSSRATRNFPPRRKARKESAIQNFTHLHQVLGYGYSRYKPPPTSTVLTAVVEFFTRTLPTYKSEISRRYIVKRLLVLLICVVLFAGSALPAMACKRHRRSYVGYGHRQNRRYTRTVYRSYATRRPYYAYNNRRSFWQRHRDALSMAIGTGGGAAVGGLLGGRRGAGIGSLVGLGSSALYTYKLRDRRRRY
ncbi:MAG: hypothetical protein JWM21_4867 [Acidobacteria bacterium]|nr:hypothetical protein [Acidobacteriota bacterium]